MPSEAKTEAKELRADTAKFVQKASPEQLLAIANATALRVAPLVKNFTNQNADELRNLIRKEFKDHADFRGMVIRKVSELSPRAPKAPKEEKAKDKPAKEEKGKDKPPKEGKAKGEKGDKGEKGKDKPPKEEKPKE